MIAALEDMTFVELAAVFVLVFGGFLGVWAAYRDGKRRRRS